MRKSRVIVLSIGLMITINACGGGETNSSTKGESYPPAIRENFLSSCEASASVNVSFDDAERLCECVLSKLESRYTIEEFVEAEQAMMAGEASGINMEALAASCV